MTEWLRDIPRHWTVAPVKRHFDVRLGKQLQNDRLAPSDRRVTYLKAKHVQWLSTHTDDLPLMWASPREINHFGIRNGDLLVCEGGEGGRCAVVVDPGHEWIIQNALHRVRPNHENLQSGDSSNLWLQFVLRAVASTGWLDAISSKATIAHFTVDKFNALMIPMPPAAEQRALVACLRREMAKIDALICKKEILVKGLEEYRTALISRTVTRGLPPAETRKAGLDPHPKFKPSGVEWLGEVPEHWEVARLKDVGWLLSGTGFPVHLQGATVGALPFYKVGDLVKCSDDGQYLTADVANRISEETAHHLGARIVPAGSVVYAKIGAALFLNRRRLATARCCIDNNMTAYTPGHRFTPEWGYYWTTILDFGAFYRPGPVPSLSEGYQGTFPIAIPPLSQQRAITRYLDSETAKIDRATDLARQEIDLLHEYRTRLIADVVTGKVDVRGIGSTDVETAT